MSRARAGRFPGLYVVSRFACLTSFPNSTVERSYPLRLVLEARVFAGIRRVAAAQTDHPDDHGKREGEQWNGRFAFTEVVEKIEDGEQRDQDGQKRGRTIKNDTPWLRR